MHKEQIKQHSLTIVNIEREVSGYKSRELDLLAQLEKAKKQASAAASATGSNKAPSSQSSSSLDQQHAAAVGGRQRKNNREENEMSGFDHEAFKSTIELLR